MNTGIYLIVNLFNNHKYIGSTSRTFKRRFYDHLSLLKNNKHHSIYLQNAWNKYGENSFKFEILEECAKEDCIKREQYYIDALNPEYNICKKAGSRLGVAGKKGVVHSDATRKILSEKAKKRGIPRETQILAWKTNSTRVRTSEENKKRNEAISLSFKNTDRSSSINALKNHNKTLKGIKVSEEKRAYLSSISVRKKVLAKNLLTNEEIIFESAKEASLKLNLKYKQLTRVCQKVRSSYKNWTFSYLKEK